MPKLPLEITAILGLIPNISQISADCNITSDKSSSSSIEYKSGSAIINCLYLFANITAEEAE